ncbi:MAG: hypothetical protein Hals2KO_37730 [Halioglobus sp.]
MIWIKRGLLTVLVLILLVVIAIFATGNGNVLKLVWDFTTGAPAQPFDPEAQPAAPPDYTDEENWAALPWTEDEADMVPAGVTTRWAQGESPVDVFFIHPTGFLKGSSWTFDMNPDTSTEENTRWMLANNASAYNGCCNVYAPRYRQASIFTYFSVEKPERETILGFAYQDVARAFDYYLQHYNEGRPFVLASHSQGTHHGVRLLREKIDGTPVARQLVAAYLIGGGVEKSKFDGLSDVTLCDSPEQLSCAVHWDTFSVVAIDDQEAAPNVCTNPLSWKNDGPLADKAMHRGAVPTSGEYHVQLSGDDAARDVVFEPLAEPLPNYIEAQCRGGKLFITDQSETEFGTQGVLGFSYHGLDYPIFHMDIRDNALLRVDTYLAQRRNNALSADGQ